MINHPHRDSASSAANRLTARTTRFALLSVLAVLFAVGAGCQAAPHIDSDVAYSYRTSVELGPVARGWDRVWVGRLLDRPRIIAHKIEVQADLAGDLVRMSSGERGRLVAEASCPGAEHPIWSQLQNGQDVEVELATKKNGPFATVSCRRVVF